MSTLVRAARPPLSGRPRRLPASARTASVGRGALDPERRAAYLAARRPCGPARPVGVPSRSGMGRM